MPVIITCIFRELMALCSFEHTTKQGQYAELFAALFIIVLSKKFVTTMTRFFMKTSLFWSNFLLFIPQLLYAKICWSFKIYVVKLLAFLIS